MYQRVKKMKDTKHFHQWQYVSQTNKSHSVLVHARFYGWPGVFVCYGCVCPGIRPGGSLNAGVLGSVHWWLPGWQAAE